MTSGTTTKPNACTSLRRRDLLALATACAVAATPAHAGPDAAACADLRRRALAGIGRLPGTVSLKVWAPATRTEPELLIVHNAAQRLFVGSAIKAFILCKRMQQLDGPDILARLTATDAKGEIVPDQLLTLDETVWNADSASFLPPYLSGHVTERTAMEAMILHSDNTGTDMVLERTGADKVRTFLAQAGLRRSAVPDSTRAFFGYLLGRGNGNGFTWADLVAANKSDAPLVNSPLNNVQTLASSTDDLVSFYARSLQGEFFTHPETLQQFRDILTLADVINLVPFPAGATAYAKGGSIDVPGFHAVCIPGALFFNGRWVYFAGTLNWTAAGTTDAPTAARFVAFMRDVLALVYAGLT